MTNTDVIGSKNRLFLISVFCFMLLLIRTTVASSSRDLVSTSGQKSKTELHFFTPQEMPSCFIISKNKILQASIEEPHITNLRYKSKVHENQVEEIFGLNDTKEFEYNKKEDGKYHIKDQNKTYVLPINSVVLCISVDQQETEMHLAKLIKIDPIPMIKDKIFSICKNPDDLQIMKNYYNKLKVIRNRDIFKLIEKFKELFVKILKQVNIHEQNVKYVEIDRLFEEIFNCLEERFKFQGNDPKIKKTTAEEKALIEKSIRDLRNEYPGDLTSKKAAFIKLDFIKIPIEYTKEIYDGERMYSKISTGKSVEEAKQTSYDIIKMYLELLKNKFILAENNLPDYINKSSPSFISSSYFSLAFFCWNAKEILRYYVADKPDSILPLIRKYIDEIPGLFAFIKADETINILKIDPGLLLDENNINKFFADEHHRSNSFEYYTLKYQKEKINKRNYRRKR